MPAIQDAHHSMSFPLHSQPISADASLLLGMLAGLMPGHDHLKKCYGIHGEEAAV